MNNAMRTTRKVLVAIGVIGVFFVYTFALRGQKSNQVFTASGTKAGSTSSSATGSSSGSSGSSGSGSGSSGSSGGSTSGSATYKDGSYTGSVADAFYGNIQVQVTISGGKITDISFLQAPNDNPNSQYINQQADPMLKQEAIQSQSANVDTITGATDSSMAFVQSLSAALNQAKA
jgi:uncharacterized protein with FMN-binding domain